MMKKLTKLTKTLLVAAGLCMGQSAWAQSTKEVTLTIKDHMNILGSNQYDGFTDGTLMKVYDQKTQGAAPIMTFQLDEDFDAAKVLSATLKLYVTSKPTDKTRSGNLNVFGLNALPSTTGSGWSDPYQFENGTYKYKYFLSNNTRNFFSQNYSSYTAFTSVSHNTKGSDTYMKVGEYNDIDITSYITSLSSKSGGDNIYIGLSVANDFAADTYFGGLGHANPAKIEIVYSTATVTSYSVLFRDEDGNAIYGKNDVTGLPVVVGGEYNGSAYHDTFTIDGIKYVYKEGDETKKAVEDPASNVITLTFREADKFNYTVSDIFGNVLASGQAYSGNDVYYGVPYYVFKNNKFYEKPSLSSGSLSYGQGKISAIAANMNITVEYTEEANTNVVFFSEAENLTGATSYEDQYTGSRMSNSKVGYFVNQTAFTTLPAGVYTITSSTRAGTTKFYAGKVGEGTEILNISSSGSVSTQTSTAFTVNEPTDIYTSIGSTGIYFDYVIIRKIANADSEIVGTLDNTTEYATKWNTTPIWINAGETGYYKIINHNNTSSTKLYENWYLFGATEASDNVVVFGPNHSNTAEKANYTAKPTFTMADLDRATVELYTTLEAAGDGTYTLTTKAVTTKIDGTTLTPDLVYTQTGLDVSKLKLYVSVEKSWLEVIEQAIDCKIASSGYSSLATANGLNFAGISGLTAFVVTGITKNAVTLTSVDELPASSGVILKGTAGTTYSIPVKADAAYTGTNKLQAAVEATDIKANEAYILQGGEFHLVTAASTVPAGKAYLLAKDVPASARSLSFMFGDEASGISDVVREMQGGEFYNLSGQRVATPKSGLYIVNGKKVIIK